MEYVYAAMLLHSAGKEVNEENVTKVLKAPGLKVDEARVKALVAALDGVNIDEAIKKAAIAPVAQAPAQAATPAQAKEAGKKEEKKEEKKESEEDAMAGLGALFG